MLTKLAPFQCKCSQYFSLFSPRYLTMSYWNAPRTPTITRTTPYHWPFARGIHRRPVDSPHKGPVIWKSFPVMTSSYDALLNPTSGTQHPAYWGYPEYNRETPPPYPRVPALPPPPSFHPAPYNNKSGRCFWPFRSWIFFENYYWESLSKYNKKSSKGWIVSSNVSCSKFDKTIFDISNDILQHVNSTCWM